MVFRTSDSLYLLLSTYVCSDMHAHTILFYLLYIEPSPPSPRPHAAIAYRWLPPPFLPLTTSSTITLHLPSPSIPRRSLLPSNQQQKCSITSPSPVVFGHHFFESSSSWDAALLSSYNQQPHLPTPLTPLAIGIRYDPADNRHAHMASLLLSTLDNSSAQLYLLHLLRLS